MLMVPDLPFVRKTFTNFNCRIFNSELPEPRFALTKARTFRGKLVYRLSQGFLRKEYNDYEMRFSIGFDLPTEEWEDVVIHEMIHLYIVSKKIKDRSSHGPVFRKMMAEINSCHGRHIVISSRSTESQLDADKRIRGHFLCIAKFNDGRLGVAPVTKTRIFSLWNEYYKIPGVESIKWVGSTDPWFNRFPRAMKVKLYLTSREELLPHLKGGVLLERDGSFIRPVSRRCSPDELLP